MSTKVITVSDGNKLVKPLKARGMIGDIACARVEALIAPINSEGMWWGAIDSVIERCGGNQFHNQARAAMPLSDGQVVVAKKTTPHLGCFGDVVFVIDDLQRPLRALVLEALRAADAAGYRSVSLPAMRTGVMRGAVEKTALEAVQALVEGVHDFAVEGARSLEEVVVVVYNDRKTLEALELSIQKCLPAPV